jgi:hypothetical protein
VTGPDTAIPTSAPGESERRWSTTRRAADLIWVIALLIAIPLSPVARWYLLTWPGVVEWSLVVVIAVGIVVHTIADRRLRALPSAGARADGSDATPVDVKTPPRSRTTIVVGWMVVVLLLPVVWACLMDPLIAATSFGWGPIRPFGAFEPVLIATFLICPYLVGLLVWWLARGVGSTPERLIVAILVACATGLLVYGSLGYLPPMLSGLL